MRNSGVLLLLLLAFLPTRMWSEELVVCGYQNSPFLTAGEEGLGGFEYELLLGFAESLNRDLVMSFEASIVELLAAVEEGRCALGAGIVTITEKRQEQVAFSRSYFPVRVVFIEPKGRPASDIDDLYGMTVATIAGSSYEELLAGVPGITLVYGGSTEELARMTLGGQADGFACDSATALPLLQAHPSLQLGIALSDRQDYGFALAKGSPLKPVLDEYLSTVVSDGSYRALLEMYFDEETVARVLE